MKQNLLVLRVWSFKSCTIAIHHVCNTLGHVRLDKLPYLGFHSLPAPVLEEVVHVEASHCNEDSKVKWNKDSVSQLCPRSPEVNECDSNIADGLDDPHPPSASIELSLVWLIRELLFLIRFIV